MRLYLKNKLKQKELEAKRAGDVPQVVESCLGDMRP
jgi:hypothetical protein